MEVKIIRAGLRTGIQDMGRVGWGSCGVPESGVMDRYAAGIANLLLGNKEHAAVLEMMMIGAKLQFRGRHALVLGGLGVKALLNGQQVDVFEPLEVKNGDTLDVKRIEKGNFAYLAINDGFQREEILSGRSMYKGISSKGTLEDGEKLSAVALENKMKPRNAGIAVDIERYTTSKICVYPGPEFDLLSANQQQLLTSRTFTVTPDSNRMAFMLKEKISIQNAAMLTSPVLPGTVQLTSGGNLMILMRDAQVTGGYPRILQLTEADLNILSQKRPGEKIQFQLKSGF